MFNERLYLPIIIQKYLLLDIGYIPNCIEEKVFTLSVQREIYEYLSVRTRKNGQGHNSKILTSQGLITERKIEMRVESAVRINEKAKKNYFVRQRARNWRNERERRRKSKATKTK